VSGTLSSSRSSPKTQFNQPFLLLGTQPSDTVSSSANVSSSLQSLSSHETQKSTQLSTKTKRIDNESGLSASGQSSKSASRQSCHPACGNPSDPASGLSSHPAPGHHSDPVSISPSNPASGPPFSHATHEPSSQASVPPQAPLPPAGDVARNPVLTDASTATNEDRKTATVSYGTLSSVVSITTNAITVQSSPAVSHPVVPGREANNWTRNAATANAATMTSPPASIAERRTSEAVAAAAKPAPVSETREDQESAEERPEKKSG